MLVETMDETLLPFKVGQFIEERSFEEGYRGAWFRCGIVKVSMRRHEMWLGLKYRDYPDEKMGVIKAVKKSKWAANQIMVRPCFPLLYHEGQMPDIANISEVAVIANEVWKVGDLVDWWSDGCYWSGRLTDVLGEEKFTVELFPPPVGEGATYEALSKDLRPSLDWSLQRGWTLPVPKDGNCQPCARLLTPKIPGSANSTSHIVYKRGQLELVASVDRNVSLSLCISENSICTPDETKSMIKSPSIAAATLKMQTTEMAVTGLSSKVGENDDDDSREDPHPSKKMKTDGKVPMHCMYSDTMEAAILDLEELINKVKWMKGMLEFRMSPSGSEKVLWNFVEHKGLSRPR